MLKIFAKLRNWWNRPVAKVLTVLDLDEVLNYIESIEGNKDLRARWKLYCGANYHLRAVFTYTFITDEYYEANQANDLRQWHDQYSDEKRLKQLLGIEGSKSVTFSVAS